jgi:hypothetical protein
MIAGMLVFEAIERAYRYRCAPADSAVVGANE